MPNIEDDIEQIRRAVYGRDVREAIADGIEHCYSDVTTGATAAYEAAEELTQQVSTALSEFQESSEQAIDACNNAASNAEGRTTSAIISLQTISNSIQSSCNSAAQDALAAAGEARNSINGIDINSVLFGTNEPPMTPKKYIINTNGIWSSSGSTHIVFPCVEGDTVAMIANSDTSTIYAFLADYVVADQTTPTYANGETGRHTVTKGNSESVTAPEGTNWLYIADRGTNGAPIYLPSSIKINGVEMLTHVSKDLADLRNDVAVMNGNVVAAQGAIEDVADAVDAIDDSMHDELERVRTIEPTWATVDKSSDIFTLRSQQGYFEPDTGRLVLNPALYRVLTVTFNRNVNVYIERFGTDKVVGAVVYTEELETLPESVADAAPYFVCGARTNKSGYPLPTSETQWSVKAGQMLAICVQDVTSTATNFWMTYTIDDYVRLADGVKFAESQKQDIIDIVGIKRPVIEYDAVCDDAASSAQAQISLYLPAKVGYIKYSFIKYEDNAKNALNWRIYRAYACDDSKNILYPITNAGEWEMAIKITGRDDFIGGVTHGDEVLTAFAVLIDGVPVADITGITEREFDIVRIIETTLMYDPNDTATLETRGTFTPVGTHGREYIATADGIRLAQEVTMDSAQTLAASYMTMLPIIRGNDTASAAQITDHYYGDDNYTVYDVSVGESGSAGYGWHPNVTRATIWGETSGVSATVEMLKQPEIENTGARKFQVQNTLNAYNKLYWSICGVGQANYSASAGERFVTDSVYKINRKTTT